MLKMEVRPGPPGEPPKRPRAWLGATGVMGLILGAVLLATISDCSDREDAQGGSTDGRTPVFATSQSSAITMGA